MLPVGWKASRCPFKTVTFQELNGSFLQSVTTATLENQNRSLSKRDEGGEVGAGGAQYSGSPSAHMSPLKAPTPEQPVSTPQKPRKEQSDVHSSACEDLFLFPSELMSMQLLPRFPRQEARQIYQTLQLDTHCLPFPIFDREIKQSRGTNTAQNTSDTVRLIYTLHVS